MTLASCLPLLTKYPSPGGDEPGFVDVAVNVANRGVLGTPAYEGLLPGAEAHIYWQPPLYFLGLAGWFSVFDVGLVQARSFSLFWAVTIVILVYAIARRHAPSTPSVIAAGLLAVSYWLTNRAGAARMDAMCVALTLASILIYQLGHDRARLGLFGLSGLVAGLAFLTHPLGIVAVATLTIHLVVSERRGVLSAPRTQVLLASFALPVAGWIGYIFQDPESFRLQMGAQLARKQQLGSYWYQFWMAKTHAITLVVVLGAAAWLMRHRSEEEGRESHRDSVRLFFRGGDLRTGDRLFLVLLSLRLLLARDSVGPCGARPADRLHGGGAGCCERAGGSRPRHL